jgi:hypothetical protein
MTQTESLNNPASFDREAKPMTRTVALRCWSSNDQYNADFDYGIVEITPELIQLIEKRRALFNVAYAEDRSLSRMVFWDYTPEFRAERDLEAFADEQAGDGDQPQWFKSLADGAEVEDLPESFVMPNDKDGDFRTDYDGMQVTELGVYWTVIPKHAGIRIDTAELSYKDLAEMLESKIEVAA